MSSVDNSGVMIAEGERQKETLRIKFANEHFVGFQLATRILRRIRRTPHRTNRNANHIRPANIPNNNSAIKITNIQP
jgi:hypothetical protein